MLEIFSDLGPTTIVIVGLLAIVTAAVHGATGVAGGFLMTAALAFVIGVKPVVPVMSVALLISHLIRIFLNRNDFNKEVFWLVFLPATPCIIAAAWVYGKMSSTLIAVVLGLVILALIPLRRWADARQIRTTRGSLISVAMVYGSISGASVGSGMLLVPFILGYGLTKEAFVATLAAIAFTTNMTRIGVYSSTSMLDPQFLLLGIFVGLMTIPGNLLGRHILRRMTNQRHALLVDLLTIFGALNFFWMALYHG
ncbi:MAG: sulfite exporter TauE/SafE family protein [Rhizobiaceae bacterium]